jgi:hypothetical protein
MFEIGSILSTAENGSVVTEAYLKFKDLSQLGGGSYADLYDKLSHYISTLTGTENGKPVYYVYLKVNIQYDDLSRHPDLIELEDSFKDYVRVNAGYFSNVVAIAPYANINGEVIKDTTRRRIYPGLPTDFWKHGQAGIIDIADDIMPTKWYGRVHPFEFEFIVADAPFE